MSAAYPYLHGLRKGDLTELAEASKLSNYSNLKKAELEEALDGHLAKNQTKYGSEPALSDYYKKLGTKSPVKKMVEKVTEMVEKGVKSDDDVAVKKSRRKTVAPTEGESMTSAMIKTPAKELVRRSTAMIPSNFPASPAVVTDVIDRQTSRMRSSISDVYEQSRVSEYLDRARELLSSPNTIVAISTAVEAYGLRKAVFPSKSLYDIPAIKYVTDSKTTIYAPDVFLFFNTSFWAPSSLWMLTSLLLPLTISYFINLPLKAHPSHSHKTRKAAVKASPQMEFDPLIFNVAKALIAYVVYAHHEKKDPLFGLYSHFTVSTVNSFVLGGYGGMITSSSIGALISLYEAVLKK